MSNINTLNEFFLGDKNNIFLLSIDSKIHNFYMYIIAYYANLHEFEIHTNNYIKINNFNLFQKRSVQIYEKSSEKIINLLVSNLEKKIILVDYKNFKIFSKNFLSLNTYDYQKDINYFLKKILNVDNKLLIEFVSDNPEYINSELKKYEVNTKNYMPPIDQIYTDKILEIRKSIFSIKKNKINLKDFYKLIKEEVIPKKFNFLTY